MLFRSDHPEQFWQSVWEQLGVIGVPVEPRKGVRTPLGLKAGALVDGDKFPGARWFPGMRLNFAQNLLRKHDSSEAIIFWGEDKVKRKVTWAELNNQVSRCAQGLKAAGVPDTTSIVTPDAERKRARYDCASCHY